MKKNKKLKRILEIIFLLLLITWVIFFLIDYTRYQKGTKPLITIKTTTYEYPSGNITEYLSFGYIFRKYDLKDNKKIELTPFWSKHTEPSSGPTYPELDTNYIAPNNPEKLPKINNILFFYSDNGELLLHYRCLNSESDCHIAYSTPDPYDITSEEVEMLPYENYVFIDDSTNQEKIIYIVDTKTQKIVYQVSGIVAATTNKDGKGLGVGNQYIVINSNNKYGRITIGDTILENIPYSYDYIKYNNQSNTYITKAKYWLVTNFNDNIYVANNPIVDAYLINNNYYFLSRREEKSNNETKIYYKLIDTNHLPKFKSNYLSIKYFNNAFYTIDENLNLSIRNINDQKLNPTDIKVAENPLEFKSKVYDVSLEDNQIIIKIYHENNPIIDYYYLNATTYAIETKTNTEELTNQTN